MINPAKENMKFPIILMVVVDCLLMISCHRNLGYSKRTFSLRGYQRFKNDSTSKLIFLTVLKVYPAELTCLGYQDYANLYVARMSNGKILYVFEYCQKVDQKVFDTTGRYVPLIDPGTVLNSRQDSVSIFVPQDFSIPTGAEYMFGKLGMLTES
jgi:hypothetical protein